MKLATFCSSNMSGSVALFQSCRRGDIDHVRNLLENGEAELNLRDRWDSTPLYYACLCGHEELVKYLLQNGARCAPNTFDGERCLYAALTDKIKNILRSYKAITPECMRRDSYREFLRRCLEDCTYADVCFLVHGVAVHAHRMVLSARSSYFAHKFTRKWRDRSIIELKHKLVKPWAFNAILQYLYTDRLYIAMDQIDDCLRLAKQCKLEYLENQLQMRLNSIQMFGTSKKRSITVVSIEPESQSSALQDAFARLAEAALPSPFMSQQFPKQFPFEISLDLFEVPLSAEDPPPFFDVCFIVGNYRFYGHKLFFCGRSDYFRALLEYKHSEPSSPGKEEFNEPVAEVFLNDVPPDVFAAVVAYIYQDNALVTEENVFSVLCFSDVYLLSGLKRLCSRIVTSLLDTDNVVTVLRTARLFNLPKLEVDCCEFMSKNLEKIIDNKEFHSLILEDAASVRERQETDSIPVVDDIRFHLMRRVLPYYVSDEEDEVFVDCEGNLQILDNLLVYLGIEC
ncbi:ankyrin repeat and BTB/POZ domain-containing protein 1-like isoform X1 [Montipora foliosa]|uniref:ankyrin repeat and BTB/POZ domain-containing protein 1-like isoform X1 n=2 Tax=Montipora foliosa TaxID=591990 RepID=UPI0035F21073